MEEVLIPKGLAKRPHDAAVGVSWPWRYYAWRKGVNRHVGLYWFVHGPEAPWSIIEASGEAIRIEFIARYGFKRKNAESGVMSAA
jgi:hypothetical protein